MNICKSTDLERVSTVQFPSLVLACLLLSSCLGVSSIWLDGLQSFFAATSLGIAAFFLTARDRTHLLRTLVLAMTVAGMAALWIALQWAPLDIGANPIWANVGAALGKTVRGRISIDPPATLACLADVFVATAILIASAAVTINRVRAERFFVLICLLMVGGTVSAAFFDTATSTPDAGFAEGGVIASLGCAYFFYERFETRFAHTPRRFTKLALIEAALLCAAVGCASLMIAEKHDGWLIGTLVGVVIMVTVVAVRRLGLTRWHIIAVAAFVAVGGLMGLTTFGHRGSLALALSTASPLAREKTQRMIDEAPRVGIGAGSIRDIAQLYSPDAADIGFEGASSAARLQIELGGPAAAILGTLIAVLALALLRGALRRGRDSVYALTGGALVTALAVGALCEGGLESRALMIPTAALLGLALVQSESQAK